MRDLVYYLIIAIVAGGAVPLIISYLTKKIKKPGNKNH